MGEKADPAKPGYAFVTALAKLMERTGMDKLAMSGFNINKDDLPKVARVSADASGAPGPVPVRRAAPPM